MSQLTRRSLGQIKASLIKKNPDYFPARKKTVINTDTIIIEIGRQCLTGCKGCYLIQGVGVGKKLSMTPLNQIKKTIRWIEKFTSVRNIYFLGGEPLLHPNLPQMIAYAHKRGFEVAVITSGVAPDKGVGKDNLEFLIELYALGAIDIELSFYYGLNTKKRPGYFDYGYVFKRLATVTERRILSIENRLRLVDDMEIYVINLMRLKNRKDKLHIVSTATLDKKFASISLLKKMWTYILSELITRDVSTCTFTTDDGVKTLREVIAGEAVDIAKAFAPYNESAPYIKRYTFSLDNIKGEKHAGIRFWHQVGVTMDRATGVVTTTRPQGTLEYEMSCPSMRIILNKTRVTTDTLLVRATDGEIVFPEPSCITVTKGIANTREKQSRRQLFKTISTRVSVMQQRVKDAKRSQAEALGDMNLMCKADTGSCHSDDYVCPSCPFDKICGACHSDTYCEEPTKVI